MTAHHCAAAAGVVALLVMSGCSACRCGDGARVADATPRLATASELSDAERRWGSAPPRTPDITYQPDVVLVDDGPDAVRGMSGNGVEYFLDAARVDAAGIQPGKVLFATTRVVGRVLGVRREDSRVAVVLGPVLLTDVYRDLSVTLDQPVDFAETIPYSAPDMPGSHAILEQREARRATSARQIVPARFTGEPLFPVLRLAQTAAPTKFRVTPLVGANGLGVRLASDENGLRIMAQAVLYLNQPRLKLHINIAGGVLRVCELELSGAAGLMLSIDAASQVGVNGNIQHNEPSIPVDFSLPIWINKASPFAITVRQAFIVNTAFGGKGTLKSTADYALTGSFSVGFRDGHLGCGAPASFSMRQDPLGKIAGVSLGTTGLVLAHSVKVIVGVGAFGFATGPYVRLNSSLGISKDSALAAMTNCRAATFGSSIGVGIGYVMPRVVSNAINVFLRALNLGQIKGEGGIESELAKIIEAHSVAPKIKACGA